MSKIFIDVSTPGNGNIYEFQLDSSMTVGQVKVKMIEEITEIENGNITLNPDKVMLCNLNTRVLLSEEDTLKQGGIKSGQRLLLV